MSEQVGTVEKIEYAFVKGLRLEVDQEAATQTQLIQRTDQTYKSDQEAPFTYLQAKSITVHWGSPSSSFWLETKSNVAH